MIPQDHYESTILCSHASVPRGPGSCVTPKTFILISNDRLLLVAVTGQSATMLSNP